MSSFNNVNGNASRFPFPVDSESIHLRTGSDMPSSKSARTAAAKPNWSNLLFAAKVAYSKGYKSDALRLYKEGLTAASQSMDKRDELIEFLTVNVWS
jgi:hypothetical protein